MLLCCRAAWAIALVFLVQLSLQNSDGIRLMVSAEDNDPALRIELPDSASERGSINVLFPEHVTAVRRGSNAEQLYLFRPGRTGRATAWRAGGRALEYERDLAGGIRMLARASLEDDGVRFRYDFTNGSDADYDMITAVTDPRLTGSLHDVRLERTYVHHTSGFELLASETPDRVTMPIDRWLPARYLASYTWPVPAQRVERRADGISYYTRSRAVDAPFIATRSTGGGWVVASFTREAGNVWSNPELTCQHVDPQAALPARGRVVLEVKVLIIRGSLEDAFQRALRQRPSMP
jgi:hypothetical protein